MQLRNIIESPCGIGYVIEQFDLQSSFARRHLLEKEMMTDEKSIAYQYDILRKYISSLNNKNNANSFNTLRFKLKGLKDIHQTIHNLQGGNNLDDIELFEIKYLAILSEEIRLIINKLDLEKAVSLDDLNDVISILDPDGLKIGTFYIYDSYSPQLKELRTTLKHQTEYCEKLYLQIEELESKIRKELCAKLRKFSNILTETLYALAEIDIVLAKAQQMMDMNLSFPEISEKITEYQRLFHPQVLSILKLKNQKYQPVDISFGDRHVVLTGSNMGGKTIVVKTLALCQYLFQFGFGIPAEKARITLKDEVFCCTTDNQSYRDGLSSFGAEMIEINNIISASKTTKRVLALVDEPARSTNPVEGTALVSALLQVLKNSTMDLVVVTHYNVDTCDCRCLRVKGLEQGKMNYELVEVERGEVPHEALTIAESLGVDKEWLEKAREVLKGSNSTQLK